MRSLLGWLVGGLVVGGVVYGCSVESSNSAAPGCVPGASQSCAGESDCAGYQICNDEGTGFEPCQCGQGPSGGATSGSATGAGGEGGEGPTSSTASASASGGSGALATSTQNGSSQASTTATSGTTSAGGGESGTSGGSTTSAGGETGTGGGGSTSTSTTTATTGQSCSGEPAVLVLVDASSSMWDNGYWDTLKSAVLGTVQELQGDVRFGLTTFTGAASQTCPLDLQSPGDPVLNNYATIEAFYSGFPAPQTSTETPTPAALHVVGEQLAADTGTTRKAILLVTDGNPDYCDNGVSYCRADTTVRVIQDVYKKGIDVLVAALPDISIDQNWLLAFANAGVGQPVSAPQDPSFCPALPSQTAAVLWDIDPGTWPMASYAEQMGSAVPAALNAGDVTAMQASITALVSGWAACD